jgi:hypothetical protein
LPPGAWGSFFKILYHALGLGMMTRASREFAVAHGTQRPAEHLLGDRDTELLEYPLREIDQSPAHHAMDRWDRPAFDHPGDRLALGVIELAGLSRRLAVQQPVGPASIEPPPPIPDDLEINTTDLCRLGARRTVVDRSKRLCVPKTKTRTQW